MNAPNCLGNNVQAFSHHMKNLSSFIRAFQVVLQSYLYRNQLQTLMKKEGLSKTLVSLKSQ